MIIIFNYGYNKNSLRKRYYKKGIIWIIKNYMKKN